MDPAVNTFFYADIENFGEVALLVCVGVRRRTNGSWSRRGDQRWFSGAVQARLVQNKTDYGGRMTTVTQQLRRSHIGSSPGRDAVQTCN